MSVVFEVYELIAPLSDNSERIFEKGNDDKEAANGREISALTFWVSSHILHQIAIAPVSRDVALFLLDPMPQIEDTLTASQGLR